MKITYDELPLSVLRLFTRGDFFKFNNLVDTNFGNWRLYRGNPDEYLDRVLTLSIQTFISKYIMKSYYGDGVEEYHMVYHKNLDFYKRIIPELKNVYGDDVELYVNYYKKLGV